MRNVAEHLRNNIERHLPEQLVKNYPDERMDRIEKANKDKMSDLVEVERKNKDDKTVVVYQPKDVEVIDTSAFIKAKIDYGLDFVFHLMDSVALTIISLIDNGVSGFAWGTDACLCLPQFGWRPEDPLSSDQLAGKTSLIFLDSKDLAVTGKQNIYCCINSFQPRCWPTPVIRASMA